MGLAQDQEIPKKKVEASEPWTFRRLFPFGGTASSLAKVFVNPLEVLLAYIIFIMGIAVVFNRSIPWMFYIITIFLLGAVIFERATRPIPAEKSQK